MERRSGGAVESVTGGEAVIDALLANGLTTVFGIPGGHLLALYDGFVSRPALSHFLTRHEQAAGFAAIGYSRTARTTGVCIGTTGPGFTNLVTPLGEAYVGFDPIIALAGQVPSARIRPYRGDLHEVPDQRGVAAGLTRWSAVPSSPGALAAAVSGAARVVASGTPGPAYVELAADLLAGDATEGDPDGGVPTVEPGPGASADEHVAAVARTLETSERPVILAGRGVGRSRAERELRRLAEALGAPVLVTPGGAGAIPADHPLFAGVLCPFDPGQPTMSLLRDADVTLVVGSRLGAITTGNWRLALNDLIQVDVDPEAIGWNHPVRLGLVGRANEILARIVDAVDEHRPAAVDGWGADRAARSRREHAAAIVADRDLELSFVAGLRAAIPRDVPVVIDSMMFNLWLGWYWDTFEPTTTQLSSRFDAMGAAIPIAMGAAVARSGSVVAICGDGGFGISAMELATLVKYGLDVTVLVINDDRLGSVADGQQARFGRLSQANLTNPDIVAFGRSFGIEARRAEDLGEAARLVGQVLRQPGPSLIEVKASIRSPW